MRLTAPVVAAGAGAVLAVALMIGSVGYRAADRWASSTPLRSVSLNAEGAGTIDGVTVRLTGVEVTEELAYEYAEEFRAPEGWVLWLSTYDVALAGEPMYGVTVSTVASDGLTYSLSEQVPFLAGPTEGWLGDYGMDTGAWSYPFLLPDGVTPERITVVPSLDSRVYWSFDV